jgi:hypothetical protein
MKFRLTLEHTVTTQYSILISGDNEEAVQKQADDLVDNLNFGKVFSSEITWDDVDPQNGEWIEENLEEE